MSDKNLKDMWNKAENLLGGPDYQSPTIERFISGRSNSIADKVRKTIQIDIALKLLFAALLLVDAVLYIKIQPTVAYVSMALIAGNLPLVWYLFRVLHRFSRVADYGLSPKEKLSGMLTFLRSRFFTAILAISSTYIFLFISGLLMYFFVTYGELRRLGNMDVFVFTTLCTIGVTMNFLVNHAQVRYHIKHIEACLSDLNDNVLALVTNNIELQQKQDRNTKILFMLLLVVGFVVFIAILKKIGF